MAYFTARILKINEATIPVQYRRRSKFVRGLGADGFQVRNPIPLKIRHVWGLLLAKSYVGSHKPSRWCGVKIPTLAGLPKKGVRPREDQPGESCPTSIYRYNKMIQALIEQGLYFQIQERWEYKHGLTHLGGERKLDLLVLDSQVWRMILIK
ncbi:hypothetical protein AVEN_184676-1 [Araneus ventricosus]|uniref:Uncharacterized protein n=1 Tax=Araneus ventricosus TaxID=182803 RepID=A0A4Y2FTI3_ARAVE|nr:hypothetical protein AVEN_184676-1 [Araneus ventricosus]